MKAKKEKELSWTEYRRGRYTITWSHPWESDNYEGTAEIEFLPEDMLIMCIKAILFRKISLKSPKCRFGMRFQMKKSVLDLINYSSHS